MLKKLLFVSFITLASSNAIYAVNNIYLDGLGSFFQTNDAENQYGAGGGLAYRLITDLNIFNRNIFNSRKIRQTDATGEIYYNKYSYYMNITGVEYQYNIMKLPLYAQAALSLGMGQAEVNIYHIEAGDTGFCMSITAGLNYIVTQNLSTFLNIGYHKTFFFDEFENAKIMGLQVNLGVRLTVWGKNKSIFSGY